jgi:hypothetical protein
MYAFWVTDIYMNKSGNDGWTPRQRWLKYYDSHSPTVRWSREEIALLRLRPDMGTFRDSGGIQRLNLTYDSDSLRKLKDLLGESSKAPIFTDGKDMTYIFAKNPITQQIFRVPCTTDHKYTKGLTEYQQTLILKIARDRGMKNPSMRDMVESRERLRLIVEKEARSSKMKKRQKAIRVGKVAQVDLSELPHENEITQQMVKKKEVVITALEDSMLALEEVELDLSDDSWGAI